MESNKYTRRLGMDTNLKNCDCLKSGPKLTKYLDFWKILEVANIIASEPA